ncbi:MAG: hypothetical protein U9R38_07460 [Candidatus Margulisiibacteriota bacterium]|nr:hypothetical protein [Candidatus Margulisiibacteriota bacterium]
MIQTSFPLSRIITRAYKPDQIKAGHGEAFRLITFLKTNNLQKLRYNPQAKPRVNEAKRIVLMAMAARAKFEHLFPEGRLDSSERGLQISERAFEKFNECSCYLGEYPAAKNDDFRAKVDFIYDWIIGLAKNRPKNFLILFSAKGKTLSANDVKSKIAEDIQELSELNEQNHPLVFFITKYLIICPQTKLPFNIQIPF